MPGEDENDAHIIFNYKMAKRQRKKEGFTPLSADMVIERSQFRKQDGVWKFLDYQMVRCPEGIEQAAQDKAVEAIAAAAKKEEKKEE